MPTLQEDRETRKNTKNNMDIILHGNAEDVAKMAEEYKAVDSKNLSGGNYADYKSGRLHPVNNSANAYRSAPAYKTNTESASNFYNNSRMEEGGVRQTEADASERRSNALRPEAVSYRNKFEPAYYRNQEAGKSAYDGINDQLRSNPRPSPTPVLNNDAVNRSAQASFANNQKARDAMRYILTTPAPRPAQDTELKRGDTTPNATQNRQREDVESPMPTNETMKMQRQTMSFDPNDMKDAKEQASIRQSKQETTIPTQVKVIAAVIAAAIILAFTVIFINSALLNSLNAEMDELSVRLETMSADAETLKEEINVATSSETIEEYAKSAGMIYLGD